MVPISLRGGEIRERFPFTLSQQTTRVLEDRHPRKSSATALNSDRWNSLFHPFRSLAALGDGLEGGQR